MTETCYLTSRFVHLTQLKDNCDDNNMPIIYQRLGKAISHIEIYKYIIHLY